MKIRLAPSIVLAVASSVCLTHAAQKPLKGQSPVVAAPARSGGATGWFNGTTQQDLGNILGSCGSAVGLKTVAFGIGAVHGG